MFLLPDQTDRPDHQDQTDDDKGIGAEIDLIDQHQIANLRHILVERHLQDDNGKQRGDADIDAQIDIGRVEQKHEQSAQQHRKDRQQELERKGQHWARNRHFDTGARVAAGLAQAQVAKLGGVGQINNFDLRLAQIKAGQRQPGVDRHPFTDVNHLVRLVGFVLKNNFQHLPVKGIAVERHFARKAALNAHYLV